MVWNAVQLVSKVLLRQRTSSSPLLGYNPVSQFILSKFFQPQLALQLDGPAYGDWMDHSTPTKQQNDEEDDYSNSIWFAVPKRKHTRSRKRKKTTVQKRLPVKENIVFDPRTGEVTLKHKLPFNWKDYLDNDSK